MSIHFYCIIVSARHHYHQTYPHSVSVCESTHFPIGWYVIPMMGVEDNLSHNAPGANCKPRKTHIHQLHLNTEPTHMITLFDFTHVGLAWFFSPRIIDDHQNRDRKKRRKGYWRGGGSKKKKIKQVFRYVCLGGNIRLMARAEAGGLLYRGYWTPK